MPLPLSRATDETALATLEFSWNEIVAALANDIERGAPEVRGRKVYWRIEYAKTGLRIEIYDDPVAMAARDAVRAQPLLLK